MREKRVERERERERERDGESTLQDHVIKKSRFGLLR